MRRRVDDSNAVDTTGRADVSFTVRLPVPPSANATYVTTTAGTRAKTAHARDHRVGVRRILARALLVDPEAAAVAARLQAGDWWGLYLDVFFETPRRRDLDNVLKPTVDAIAFALQVTDSQLVDVHLSKHLDPLAPHVLATVVALSDWTFDRNEFLVLAHRPDQADSTG